MKVSIQGVLVEAPASELAILIDVMSDSRKTKETLPTLVTKSQELRRNLQNDANYNPYPGVVPSKEPSGWPVHEEQSSDPDVDTGVDYVG